MKAPLSYVPAFPAAIGMMAGIVIYNAGGGWLAATLFTVAAIAAMIAKRHWLSFVCLFAGLGWLISYMDRPEELPGNLYDSKLTWAGEITGVTKYTDAVRLTVDLHAVRRAESTVFEPVAKARCSIMTLSSGDDFEYGETVCFSSAMKRPGKSVDLPDETDYSLTHFVEGISAEAKVAPDDIIRTGYNKSLMRTASRTRDRVRDLIYLSPVASRTAWFLSATMLGDDSMLDRELQNRFRATGVAHYLALSGFHVGIVAMLAGLLLFPLKSWRRFGRLRHIAVIAFIWAYALVCGMSPSLVRAAVLISIYLMAKILQRQSSPFNSLAVAAIAILCVAPRQLYSPGFQLSFAAVLSILVFAPALTPVPRNHPIARHVTEWVAVTIAATLGTCLITMIHFHRFPLLFLLPNVLLALLLPVLIGGAAILMAATSCGLSLRWLGWIVDRIYLVIEGFCNGVSSVSMCEIDGIHLPAATTAASIVALIMLASFVLTRKRVFALSATAFLAVAVASAYMLSPRQPSSELFITRRPLRTDIVMRHERKCLLLTTAPGPEHNDICRTLGRRYHDYLSRRGCDSLTVVQGDFDLGTIKRRGDYLVIADKTILLAFSDSPCIRKGIHADYLLITRGTGKNAGNLLRKANADSVLLSADLPATRLRKVTAACDSLGIDYRDLRLAPFAITK